MSSGDLPHFPGIYIPRTIVLSSSNLLLTEQIWTLATLQAHACVRAAQPPVLPCPLIAAGAGPMLN
jgi:hypothetical protein